MGGDPGNGGGNPGGGGDPGNGGGNPGGGGDPGTGGQTLTPVGRTTGIGSPFIARNTASVSQDTTVAIAGCNTDVLVANGGDSNSTEGSGSSQAPHATQARFGCGEKPSQQRNSR
jgi:hypothetical protein